MYAVTLRSFGSSILMGMRITLYKHNNVARDILPEILQPLSTQVLSLGHSDSFAPIDTEAVLA
jgi:phosphomannomutase